MPVAGERFQKHRKADRPTRGRFRQTEMCREAGYPCSSCSGNECGFNPRQPHHTMNFLWRRYMRKCDFCKHNRTCSYADITNCAIRDYIRFEPEEPSGSQERQKLIWLLRGHCLDTEGDIAYVADYLLRNGVTIKRNKLEVSL